MITVRYVSITLLVILIIFLIKGIIETRKEAYANFNILALTISTIYSMFLLAAVTMLILCILMQTKTTQVKMTEHEHKVYQNYIDNSAIKNTTVNKKDYEKYLEAKKAAKKAEQLDQESNSQSTVKN